jgi:hypothetical protein
LWHHLNNIPLEDRNSPSGLKITQAADASLQVCQLAPSANPTNTYDSLNIYHSEKNDIKNDTFIKPKRQKLKRKYIRIYMCYKKSLKETHL